MPMTILAGGGLLVLIDQQRLAVDAVLVHLAGRRDRDLVFVDDGLVVMAFSAGLGDLELADGGLTVGGRLDGVFAMTIGADRRVGISLADQVSVDAFIKLGEDVLMALAAGSGDIPSVHGGIRGVMALSVVPAMAVAAGGRLGGGIIHVGVTMNAQDVGLHGAAVLRRDMGLLKRLILVALNAGLREIVVVDLRPWVVGGIDFVRAMAGDACRGFAGGGVIAEAAMDAAVVDLLDIVMALGAVDRREFLLVRKIHDVRMAIDAVHPRVGGVLILEVGDVNEQAGSVFGNFVLVPMAEHAVFVLPRLGLDGGGEKERSQEEQAESSR